jgi:hypothetical protein
MRPLAIVAPSHKFLTKTVGESALRSLVAQIPTYWFGVNTPSRKEVRP